MKTLPVGELKTHFSEVLADVQQGHPVAVVFGRSRKPVAMLVPYGRRETTSEGIRLGSLKGFASCAIADDFEITDDQLLGS